MWAIIDAIWDAEKAFAENHGCEQVKLTLSRNRGVGQREYNVHKRDFADLQDLLKFLAAFEEDGGGYFMLHCSGRQMVAPNCLAEPDQPEELLVLEPFGVYLDTIGW